MTSMNRSTNEFTGVNVLKRWIFPMAFFLQIRLEIDYLKVLLTVKEAVYGFILAETVIIWKNKQDKMYK